jgi:ribosomal protein L24
MHKNLFLSAAILLFAFFNLTAFAQVKPSVISGDVSSISSEKIVLKTKDGDIEAVLSGNTQYFRVPPENPTPKAAVAATFSEIGVGDKLLVTGILSDDKRTIPAKSVYLMSKSAIAERQAKEKEEWRTRGTIGKVVNFNPQTNVITISTRSLAGEKTIAVKPKDNAEFYRYAPDSIEFSKATKSKISDIEPNDEIRILGDKNADGSEIQAERIVTGAFKTNGGTIKEINIEKNEIIISDFQTKKDIAIAISDFSILKQFPAEMAQRMAQFQMAGGGQGGFRPPTQGNQQPTPQQNPQTPRPTPNGMGQGGGFRAGGGGIDDSRFPSIKISDLKVGEMIGVLSTKNPDPSRIKAIKLFSGVEPFIKMSQMAAAQGGGNRQGGGGGGASLNIPGLDGFGGN